MRKICAVLIWMVGCSISLTAQAPAQTPAQGPTPPPPQTARQALIEMFLGKGENDFAKHLPEAAHQALIHKGESPDTSTVLRISTLGREAVAQGGKIETFDVGPTLLSADIAAEHEKIEAVVEHDSLLGEEDEIELSVHYYKDGQEQTLPVIPRLIFTFKQEKEIWRLTEVVAAAHVPLTDPDYLKELRKEQDEANEGAARQRVTNIAATETSYAANHPEIGYACSLSTLFARDPAAGEEGGAAADSSQGNEDSDGYHFALTGCDGAPALKYRLTAVPLDPDANTKIFCSDESGTPKFVASGKSSACFSRGELVNPPPPAPPPAD